VRRPFLADASCRTFARRSGGCSGSGHHERAAGGDPASPRHPRSACLEEFDLPPARTTLAYDLERVKRAVRCPVEHVMVEPGAEVPS